MALDPRVLNNLITGMVALGAAFLVALWLSLIIWTYRDMRSRAREPLLRLLAAILVALLFLPGIVVYLILRPPRTLEDEYQHTLEEEALLQSIADSPVCPGCGRHTEAEWMVCPNCQTKLKKTCQNCNKLVELAWNICPYCGAPAPGVRTEAETVADNSSNPSPEEESLLSGNLNLEARLDELWDAPKQAPLKEEPVKDNGAP